MRTNTSLIAALIAALTAGCVVGNIGDGEPSGNQPGTNVPGRSDAGPGPNDPGTPTFLDVRVRRLSTSEYDAAVGALLGTKLTLGEAFPQDARQSGFTANAAQRVDDLFAAQLEKAANTLADEAVSQRLATLVPCATGTNEESCARPFIETFGKRAYRRPLSTEEKEGLFAVYASAREGASFADGVKHVIATVLQSPGFLYITELGGTATDGITMLAPYEIASALSFGLLGAPPDDELLAAAEQNRLSTPGDRETQATRLLHDPRAKAQVRRFVKEWLGIDNLEHIAKDATHYPEFAELRPSMLAETDNFLNYVMFDDDGSLKTLLTANYTFTDGAMAQFYGVQQGKTPLDGVKRRGILHHASFLAALSHANDSAPVKRGVAIRRKLLCQELEQPKNPPKPIIPPPPNPSMTTRERFANHSTDPACQTCHRLIDPVGFTFESFDPIGRWRDTDNGKPVDTSGALYQTDVDGPLANSVELSEALARSEDVKACFARQIFRFLSAQTSSATEDTFARFLRSQPPEKQANTLNLIVAYVATSDMFIKRVVR